MSKQQQASDLIKAILDERNPDRVYGYSYNAGYLEGLLADLADIPGVLERIEVRAK